MGQDNIGSKDDDSPLDASERPRRGRPRRPGGAPDRLPVVRVEPERKDVYLKALARVRKRFPDMSLSDWIRAACDNQARDDLRIELKQRTDLPLKKRHSTAKRARVNLPPVR